MSFVVRAAAVSTVGVVIATSIALGSAPATAAGPAEIVDLAGDARTALGLNVDEIDLRSVDVATVGSDLTYTFQVDNFPAAQNRIYTYEFSVRLPSGQVLTAAATNSNPPLSRLAFRSAVLAIFTGDEEDPAYGVAGSSSVDRASDTVTLRFPIAAVEAESAVRDIAVLGAAVTQVSASSSASTSFRTIATDTAAGAGFVIGE